MALDIPDYPFRAYLFDLDGTITDSMPLHYLAWSEALAEWNCPFPEEQFYAWGGRPVPDIVATLNQIHGLSMPVEAVSHTKEAHFVRRIDELQAVPEVLALVHATHGRLPMAVVSGSPRDSVVRSLEVLGILPLFDTLVCAGEYTQGKPHPEPFLKAAEQLNVAPEDCLVFEDADLGIQAATAAGMQSIKVVAPRPDAVVATAQR
jgi:HAD superfamily hydrolase (TIGR01509 family)